MTSAIRFFAAVALLSALAGQPARADEPDLVTLDTLAATVELGLRGGGAGVPTTPGDDPSELGRSDWGFGELRLRGTFFPVERLAIRARLRLVGTAQDASAAIVALSRQTLDELRAQGISTRLANGFWSAGGGVGVRLGDLDAHALTPRLLLAAGTGGVTAASQKRMVEELEIYADPGDVFLFIDVGAEGAHRLSPDHRVSLSWTASLVARKGIQLLDYIHPANLALLDEASLSWPRTRREEDPEWPGADHEESDVVGFSGEVGVELRPVGELGIIIGGFLDVGARIRSPAGADWSRIQQGLIPTGQPTATPSGDGGAFVRAVLYLPR